MAPSPGVIGPRSGARALPLAQLDGLAVGSDALGAHFVGLGTVRITSDGHLVAGAKRLLRESAVLHPRRRREDDGPYLSGDRQADMPVRMLVAGFVDGAGQRKRGVRVVLAPAVMGERGGRR